MKTDERAKKEENAKLYISNNDSKNCLLEIDKKNSPYKKDKEVKVFYNNNWILIPYKKDEEINFVKELKEKIQLKIKVIKEKRFMKHLRYNSKSVEPISNINYHCIFLYHDNLYLYLYGMYRSKTIHFMGESNEEIPKTSMVYLIKRVGGEDANTLFDDVLLGNKINLNNINHLLINKK